MLYYWVVQILFDILFYERGDNVSSNTSWQVKARYNKKVYKTVTAQLDKNLVARWEEKLKAEDLGKAEFIRRSIKAYLGED